MTACSNTSSTPAQPSSYPPGKNSTAAPGGSIFDGITLFSTSNTPPSSTSGGLAVNGFLWRASLETVSFMPILSADPVGGLIITDWYSTADAPDERVKLNIYILDRDLRADGVHVTVFRQQKTEEGHWVDAPTAPATEISLEDTILSRARQLRVAYNSVNK